MAIVYDLPFTFQVNNSEVTLFYDNEKECDESEVSSVSVCENDEIEIFFQSIDSNARLYLDALDIVPDGVDIFYDGSDRVYRCISNSSMTLYKNNGDYDALRVDTFKIIVTACEKTYYGIFEVIPKQLTYYEWNIMREDLEKEITGLAQDIVRRNMGLGEVREGSLPPEKVYEFIVINKYAKAVMGALYDLKDKAKYHINKRYVPEIENKLVNIDAETVKKYLKNTKDSNVLYVPLKYVNYDIQENRLLKRIITYYEKKLDAFIELTQEIKMFYHTKKFSNKQYKDYFLHGIEKFHVDAVKLRKVTGIIKSQEWYQGVGYDATGFIPHSFALDSRYSVIFKMYNELKHPSWNIELDSNYSYSWKRSSLLYEMWCYIKICRALSQEIPMCENSLNLLFSEKMLFPFLENGTAMCLENDKVRVNIIYDQFLPKKAEGTNLINKPFYTVARKNRPDITVDIYLKEGIDGTEAYLGSVLLECKYRKLSSYWFSPISNSERAGSSSKPQILSYFNDTRSKYYYPGVPNTRPVQKVIVLTPDVNGDNKCECGNGVINKALKPSEGDVYLQEVIGIVNGIIDKSIEDYINYMDVLKSKLR